jgi:aldose 1-epimerase
MNTIITIGHDTCRAEIWTLGAAVNGVWVPDRDGALANVHPSLASPEARLAGKGFFGEVVGPFANRIAGGRFTIDGHEYHTPLNEGPNILHSGPDGLHRQVWTVLDQGPDHVRLGCDLADGHAGFPGPIHVEIAYWVEGCLVGHTITATAERPTLANICSHAYFNLAGAAVPMADQLLAVAASRYLTVDAALIPLPSAPEPVEGPFDLSTPRRIGDLVAADHPQVRAAGGIDHAFILDQPSLGVAAVELADPASGRRLTVSTDCPAIQVYSGQYLDAPFTAMAIEAEEYPGAPGRPDFPSVVLRPGETYRRTTHWEFTAD